MSATRSPSWWPIRWSRPRTPPKRSASTGSRCRMSSARSPRSKPGAPQVWPDRPGNLAFETSAGDAAATKAGLCQGRAHGQLTIVNQRLVTNYMDTRGVIAEYDGDRYTLTLGSQGSHIIRDIIGGEVLKIPPDKMRVDHPRCRRRFRHQAVSLSRICAGRGRRRAAAQAGEMGVRPLRAFPRRQPRPRQYLHREARARRQGPVPWRSISTSSPTWARICRASRPIFPGSASAWRPASTIFRPRMCACAPPIPTPCRSMPIAAPAGRKPPI